MLHLSEFYPGTLAEAPIGSFILQTSEDSCTGIISDFNESPFFVFLDGKYRFEGFPSNTKEWSGLIIPNVMIEVDETSVTGRSHWGVPSGSIVCMDGKAGIRLKEGRTSSHSGGVAKLLSIPESSIKACFLKWEITLGVGSEKRSIMKFDTTSLNK
jgi:hypothetical protein